MRPSLASVSPWPARVRLPVSVTPCAPPSVTAPSACWLPCSASVSPCAVSAPCATASPTCSRPFADSRMSPSRALSPAVFTPTPCSVDTRLMRLAYIPPSAPVSSASTGADEGGFWLREIGLYDVDGDLIAVGNCPETYKPELKEGSGRVQTVRMVLIVSRTDAVTLKFDPTVALATRRYADTLLADHIAAANPHRQYAPLESPVFSGNPTAPTAVAGTNTTQLATTAFVALR
ncbi:phage tail protein [Dickeya chrysanthemi]|uniref:phage tail protein n=1 Tax=Dickeya chrysanthemi TaxID=556 RepID=UPI003341820F